MKGSVPVEIRTPPVVQISLNVAVTVEEFFLSNLISNLAFVLKIDVSRIRVVNIVAENSAAKRDTLSDGAINTVTLEFGDPPATNVDPPLTTTPDQDWMENDGENDNVDVKVSYGIAILFRQSLYINFLNRRRLCLLPLRMIVTIHSMKKHLRVMRSLLQSTMTRLSLIVILFW